MTRKTDTHCVQTLIEETLDFLKTMSFFPVYKGFLMPGPFNHSDVVAGFATLKWLSIMGSHVQVFYLCSITKTCPVRS